MAFSAVPTVVVGELLEESWWNTYIRDNFTAYASHDHGSTDEGSQSLGVSGGLVKARHTDASAPAAPGAGKTELFGVSGKMNQRAGAGGSVEVFAIDGHAWDET